jgi:hypothetical protein
VKKTGEKIVKHLPQLVVVISRVDDVSRHRSLTSWWQPLEKGLQGSTEILFMWSPPFT